MRSTGLQHSKVSPASSTDRLQAVGRSRRGTVLIALVACTICLLAAQAAAAWRRALGSSLLHRDSGSGDQRQLLQQLASTAKSSVSEVSLQVVCWLAAAPSLPASVSNCPPPLARAPPTQPCSFPQVHAAAPAGVAPSTGRAANSGTHTASRPSEAAPPLPVPPLPAPRAPAPGPSRLPPSLPPPQPLLPAPPPLRRQAGACSAAHPLLPALLTTRQGGGVCSSLLLHSTLRKSTFRCCTALQGGPAAARGG